MLVSVKLDDIIECKPIKIKKREFLPSINLESNILLQSKIGKYYVIIKGTWKDTGRSGIVVVRITTTEIKSILPERCKVETATAFKIINTYIRQKYLNSR